MKMNWKTKALSLFVSAALCVGLAGCALAAAPFGDLEDEGDCTAAVEQLYEKGLVKGSGGDSFRPQAPITLAELVTFLGRIAGASDGYTVPDGVKADGWSAGYLAWANANGLVDAASPAQYDALTAAQVNAILDRFAAMLKIDAVQVTADGQVTRGEAAVALAALSGAQFDRLHGVKYATVTEGADWGPAISKVVLDLGVELDKAAVSKDTFTASSVRTVPGFDFTTFQPTPATAQTVARAVTAAYVSDEKGAATDKGSHVTLELAIGPDMTEGFPFNYDFIGGLNSLIDTSYVVALKAGGSITAADGKIITMDATNPAGYAGNSTPIADEFDRSGSYTQDGITLTYASYTPDEQAAAGSTPLIIWLHGAGEGGTDPYVSIVGNKVINLATDAIQDLFGTTGAEILAPQTPTMWLDKDGTGSYMGPEDSGRSYYTDALMGLIKSYVAAHPEVDTGRIYLGGCSNGGYMTVNMLIEFPGYFAAAFPVCEAYDATWLTDERLAKLVNTPVWLTAAKTDGTVQLFQGATDPENYAVFNLELDEKGEAIPLDNFSNNLYNRMVAAGAKDVHYSLFEKVVDTTGKYFQADGVTPYEYMGHWSWLYALNNECVETLDGKDVTLFQWLSQQALSK